LRRIVVEPEKCAGCRYCELICSYYHEDLFSPTLSRVRVVKMDKFGLDLPVMCHQCEDCPPTQTCLQKALSRNDKGVVNIDRDACIECGACASVCRFKAITIVDSKPLICDLCGGTPQCVEKCPTKALAFSESAREPWSPERVLKEVIGRWGING
jgi:Fe-S-cluster-containing hydrogenase component 2